MLCCLVCVVCCVVYVLIFVFADLRDRVQVDPPEFPPSVAEGWLPSVAERGRESGFCVVAYS